MGAVGRVRSGVAIFRYLSRFSVDGVTVSVTERSTCSSEGNPHAQESTPMIDTLAQQYALLIESGVSDQK